MAGVQGYCSWFQLSIIVLTRLLRAYNASRCTFQPVNSGNSDWKNYCIICVSGLPCLQLRCKLELENSQIQSGKVITITTLVNLPVAVSLATSSTTGWIVFPFGRSYNTRLKPFIVSSKWTRSVMFIKVFDQSLAPLPKGSLQNYKKKYLLEETVDHRFEWRSSNFSKHSPFIDVRSRAWRILLNISQQPLPAWKGILRVVCLRRELRQRIYIILAFQVRHCHGVVQVRWGQICFAANQRWRWTNGGSE